MSEVIVWLGGMVFCIVPVRDTASCTVSQCPALFLYELYPKVLSQYLLKSYSSLRIDNIPKVITLAYKSIGDSVSTRHVHTTTSRQLCCSAFNPAPGKLAG
jgi:hypothetical protein